jgi:hypothetical protein
VTAQDRELIKSITAITAMIEENNETLEGICRQLGLIEEAPRPSLPLAKEEPHDP